MGGGGRPSKILVGLGEGKSEDSLWRRDLSALGPFGAEANFWTERKRHEDKERDMNEHNDMEWCNDSV